MFIMKALERNKIQNNKVLTCSLSFTKQKNMQTQVSSKRLTFRKLSVIYSSAVPVNEIRKFKCVTITYSTSHHNHHGGTRVE